MADVLGDFIACSETELNCMTMVSPSPTRPRPLAQNPLQLPTPYQSRLDTREFTPIVRTALSSSALVEDLLHTLLLLHLLLVLLLLLYTRVPHALLAVGRQSGNSVSKMIK